MTRIVNSVQPIASWRHTAILVGIFAVLAIAGYRANVPRKSTPTPNRLALYSGVILGQLLLVQYIKSGLRGVTLRDLIAPSRSALQIATDALLAALLWAGWGYGSQFIKRAFGGIDNRSAGILPGNAVEIALWIAVSVTAGVCEEIAFRGYLQLQFTALTQSVSAGIVIQALIFGASHGYQGVKSMTVIAIYGSLFGILAWWRKSLVPGMLAHFWTDFASGVLRL